MTTTTSLINNKDLKPAMKIVIPAGATLTINGEVYPTNISPGFIFPETEIGSLYLSDHLDLQPHKWVTTLETPMDASQPTWISELRAARYRTAVVGKWHFGDGEGHDPEGFDYWDVLIEQGESPRPHVPFPDGLRTEKGYATDLVTQRR